MTVTSHFTIIHQSGDQDFGFYECHLVDEIEEIMNENLSFYVDSDLIGTNVSEVRLDLTTNLI